MQIKVAVIGTETMQTRKGQPMSYAFGFEAPPGTLRQALKVVLPDGRPLSPGTILTLDVREVGESRGSLWLRGAIVPTSSPAK